MVNDGGASTIVSNRQPHKLEIIALVLSRQLGDTVGDDEIDTATGSTIKHWNSAAQAARTVLADEHHIWLKREKKTPVSRGGYRLCRKNELAGAADRITSQARRKMRKAGKVINCATPEDVKAMAPGEQIVYLQTRAVVEIASDVLSTKRKREIESTVAKNSSLLTAGGRPVV